MLLMSFGPGRLNVHQIDYLGGILVTHAIDSTWTGLNISFLESSAGGRYWVSGDQGHTDSPTWKQCLKL